MSSLRERPARSFVLGEDVVAVRVRESSRARTNRSGITLRVRAEVLDRSDILAAVAGTSNLLLLHTDSMGTVGTVSIAPTVRQTAYGIFIDLVDLLISRG